MGKYATGGIAAPDIGGHFEMTRYLTALCLVLLAAGVIWTAGCNRQQEPASKETTTTTAAGTPATSGGNLVLVTLSEYKIDMPTALPAGKTTFQARDVRSLLPRRGSSRGQENGGQSRR
jgi:hypothetical protein